MALLGCHVVSTDQIEVMPLLRRNVERNSSRVMQMNSNSDSFGSIKVAELDWGNEHHIKSAAPPFDYFIDTDVYAEHLVEPLLQTIIALSGPKTTIMLGHEIRSTSVHEQMLQTWKNFFDVNIVPKAKMDSKYQHPSIQLFIMGVKYLLLLQRRQSVPLTQILEKTTQDIDLQVNKVEPSKTDQDEEDNRGSSSLIDDLPLTRLPDEKPSESEARRYGSMAARLLRDVKIKFPGIVMC
ncbi:putative s-adenosylmethionine synthetase [Hibiscus syriacus]|uniref:S-adenosylmethionine synthetase n=1 Tax=Hibiscus syriacus TaxID=106335 RepID=A0A6A2ZCC5_HIBSY|nr:putative s-adenosylmethionine synthetase [Hibiscus syriacus]